jgi:hypothetical protein
MEEVDDLLHGGPPDRSMVGRVGIEPTTKGL